MPLDQKSTPRSSTQVESVDFDTLMLNHQTRLYAFIRSMIFNPQDARDALQDVNIILYRKKDSFTLGTNFKAWAFTIARFECLTYLARYKKKQWTTLDTGLIESLADEAETEPYEIAPRRRALQHCLSILPTESQSIIQAHYKQRTSIENSAQKSKLTATAFKQKLYRIRNRLRKCILTRLNDLPSEK